MYYYGNGSNCCGPQTSYYYPVNCGTGNNSRSNYAIVLVLFILLVIIIGCRWGN